MVSLANSSLQYNAGASRWGGSPAVRYWLSKTSDRKKADGSKNSRLFETARDGIVTIDPETGEITDLHPFVGRLLGSIALPKIALEDSPPLSHLLNGEGILKRLQQERLVRLPETSLKRNDDQKNPPFIERCKVCAERCQWQELLSQPILHRKQCYALVALRIRVIPSKEEAR